MDKDLEGKLEGLKEYVEAVKEAEEKLDKMRKDGLMKGIEAHQKATKAEREAIEKNNDLSAEQKKQELEKKKSDDEKNKEKLEKQKKDNKAKYDTEKKYYTDLYAAQVEANKKQHAEDLLKVGTSKEVGDEEFKNRVELNKQIVEEQTKFAEEIGKLDTTIAKAMDPKAVKKAEKKEKDDKWKEKYGEVAKKTAEYTTQVNGALTSMFGATTTFLAKEKELMSKELAAINEKLEAAKKVTAKAAEEFANVKAKAQAEIDKKFALKHTDTDEEKDRKEAERAAASAEIEELQALYDKRQGMADKNAEHEGEIDYKQQELTAEEVNRFNQLSTTHDGYVASLDQKMEAQKKVQKTEADLQKEVDDKQAEIKKKEKQKQRVEMAQQLISASVNIAQGITKALAMGPIIGPIMASVVGAAGAVQLAMMGKQIRKMNETDRLEDGGLLSGKRHSAGGMRIQGSNIEVEGGEYVVNRESTDKNLGLIRYINSQRRELAPTDLDSFFAKSSQGFEPPFRQAFAQGGQLPNIEPTTNIDNQLLVQAIQGIKFEPKVSVTDIHTAQSDVIKVDAWTGM